MFMKYNIHRVKESSCDKTCILRGWFEDLDPVETGENWIRSSFGGLLGYRRRPTCPNQLERIKAEKQLRSGKFCEMGLCFMIL